MTDVRFSLLLTTAMAVTLAMPTHAQLVAAQALVELSLEELVTLRITSVNRREESISGAAASVFVITSDDIRRSGATTIPEILRLAPNLQVARIDSLQHAITARGFNNSIGNKLLVLLDGRTIYTPLFSGVFWEMQDTFLQDIDRIEVISGPGATLWGANAVNGVINIITKPAGESGETLVTGETGNREYGVAMRTGGTLASGMDWRVYAKARDWDNTQFENGFGLHDAWRKMQTGFRTDWRDEKQTVTVQGDAHEGESAHRGFFGAVELTPVQISGMNLLARWTRELQNGSELRMQTYWSHSEREEVVLFSPTADIVDFDFQHALDLDTHHLVWGGGYRHGEDDVDPGLFTAFIPASRTLSWQNVFVQDEINLTPTLRLTPGIKLEWNDYTGREYLPNLRLAWQPVENQLVWAAVSRAVRAPSRFDRDIFFPQKAPFIVAGGPDFESEVAEVAELGYRGQLSESLYLSVTVFHHDWSKLRSGTPLPLPTYLANDIEGHSWGVETWANWQVASFWRLSAGWNTLQKDLHFAPGGGDTAGVDNATLHNDPDYQWSLRSSMDLGANVSVDLFLRRVGELVVEPLPAYTELNARVAWMPVPELEIALTGRNLLHADHPEFGARASRSRIDRSLLLGFRWAF
ncbi:MAG: TonB-dependent receptor [Pseudomonadota bacterium]